MLLIRDLVINKTLSDAMLSFQKYANVFNVVFRS